MLSTARFVQAIAHLPPSCQASVQIRRAAAPSRGRDTKFDGAATVRWRKAPLRRRPTACPDRTRRSHPLSVHRSPPASVADKIESINPSVTWHKRSALLYYKVCCRSRCYIIVIIYVAREHKAVGTKYWSSEKVNNWFAGCERVLKRDRVSSPFAKPLITAETGRWSLWSLLWLWSPAFQFPWTSSTAWWCQVPAVSMATEMKMWVADSWLYLLVLLVAATIEHLYFTKHGSKIYMKKIKRLNWLN